MVAERAAALRSDADAAPFLSPDGLTAAGPGRMPVPLYHRLYVILRDRIVSGAYAEGSLLPSEKELSAAFGVSRITAKRALDDLAAEGLVERVRGRGTTVKRGGSDGGRSRPGEQPITASIDGLRENLAAIGRHTAVEVLEFGYVIPAKEVRERLRLDAGETVQRAVRVRRLDGVPLSQSTTFVPERIGRAFGAADLATTPLIDLIERAGVRVGSAEQSITAVLADSLTAPRLGVGVGSPLLLLSRLILDAEACPVQDIRILYRPDRFQYRMTLTRDQAAGHGQWPAAPAPAGNDPNNNTNRDDWR